jgi:hypothetical protein
MMRWMFGTVLVFFALLSGAFGPVADGASASTVIFELYS